MDSAAAFAGLPADLRKDLLGAYEQILRNFREHRWEPAELNGGKLCEMVYCVLRGHADKKMPSKAYKPKNMLDSCRDLEKADQATVPPNRPNPDPAHPDRAVRGAQQPRCGACGWRRGPEPYGRACGGREVQVGYGRPRARVPLADHR